MGGKSSRIPGFSVYLLVGLPPKALVLSRWRQKGCPTARTKRLAAAMRCPRQSASERGGLGAFLCLFVYLFVCYCTCCGHFKEKPWLKPVSRSSVACQAIGAFASATACLRINESNLAKPGRSLPNSSPEVIPAPPPLEHVVFFL